MARLIDRQAAIDAMLAEVDDKERPNVELRWWNMGLTRASEILKQLPSAQPEIIRCKDCKHRPAFRYDDDGDRYVEGPRYQETLKNGLTITLEDETCPCVNGLDSYFSYVPKDDWFCANGERRES